MKELTPQQLGWIAGVIDFKGRISRKRVDGRVTPLLVLRVDTSNLTVAQKLCELTGVSAEPRENRLSDDITRRGCTEHCPQAHIHMNYDGVQMSNWRVSGAAAAIVLYNVLPYMVTDEGMSDLMREIIGNTLLVGRRGNSARQAVQRLVKLGWALPPGIAEQWDALTTTRRRRAA